MTQRLSVIVTTYNDARFLPSALTSVRKQHTGEIILIDDASTSEENRTSYLEHLAKTFKCNLIINPMNLGLSQSRNKAIDSASGDLIICLDADDIFFPYVLSKMVDAFDEQTDVVYGKVYERLLDAICKPAEQPWTRETWLARNPIFQSSMYRKQTWYKVDGYDRVNRKTYEDYHFWLRIWLSGGRFKEVPFVVYQHNTRPDGMLMSMDSQSAYYRRLAQDPLIRIMEMEKNGD